LILSAFYSAGLAIPFLATGLGINKFLSFYSKFRKHLHKVEVVSGVILILVGLLVMTGKSTLLTSSWLAKYMPNAEAWIKVKPAPPTTATAPRGNFELAPDVQFQTLTGQQFTLGQLRGNVVLLNFWATYCIPCREEIPVLNAMQHELESRGLKIIGASLEDNVADIESYQKDVRKFDYQVLVGGDAAKARFGGTVLPTTYLIDRDGRIRQKIIGARDRAGWEAAVKPLLDETPATAQKTN
jgi:thiol-disulfide isomerase/thioredoxin